MKLSLEALLHRLIAKGAQQAATVPVAASDERQPTSIRLKPATRHFLQAQATALNTSIQGLIDTILDGVVEATQDAPVAQLRSIRERFFLLIQAHRLDLPAATELMASEGFTLSALGDEQRLLDLMTPKAIQRLKTIFYVEEDWLNGKSDYAVRESQEGRWYKNVHGVAHYLISLRKQGYRPDLLIVRRRGADFQRAFEDNDEKKTWREEPVGVVMRVTKETPSGKEFTTYEKWQFERWNYHRCRTELKTLLAFCDQMRLHVVGHELPEHALDQLLSGRSLPATLFQGVGSATWHPDDYANFGFKVHHEVGEWLGVAAEYRKSGLPELAMEAGAAALPVAA